MPTKSPAVMVAVVVGSLLVQAIALVGCEDKASPGTGAAASRQAGGKAAAILKVTAKADGSLLADGAGTDIAALDLKLAKLKTDGGTVWYYREHPEREPHPNAMRVVELVMKYALPISMSSKPDFSDYVDDEGNSHPRE